MLSLWVRRLLEAAAFDLLGAVRLLKILSKFSKRDLLSGIRQRLATCLLRLLALRLVCQAYVVRRLAMAATSPKTVSLAKVEIWELGGLFTTSRHCEGAWVAYTKGITQKITQRITPVLARLATGGRSARKSKKS